MSKQVNELIVAQGGVRIPASATAGKQAQSDAAGNISWVAPNAAIFSPSDHGFLAWNFDPILAASAGAADGVGIYHTMLIPIRSTITVSKLNVLLAVAAVTPTANRNICALYTSAGALIAYTADQTWATVGLVSMTLTNLQAGQSFTLSPGYVFATMQGAGTTSPSFQRHNEVALGSTNTGNVGITVSPFRVSVTAAQAAGVPPSTLPVQASSNKNNWVALS